VSAVAEPRPVATNLRPLSSISSALASGGPSRNATLPPAIAIESMVFELATSVLASPCHPSAKLKRPFARSAT
jgi:hypothetical protein